MSKRQPGEQCAWQVATQSVPTPGTEAAGTQRVAALVTAEAQRGVDSFRSSGPPIYTMRSDPKAAESHSKGANFLITNSFEPSSAWSSHVHVVTTSVVRQGWTCVHCGGCHSGGTGIANT